jgi:hypothetical protein
MVFPSLGHFGRILAYQNVEGLKNKRGYLTGYKELNFMLSSNPCKKLKKCHTEKSYKLRSVKK